MTKGQALSGTPQMKPFCKRNLGGKMILSLQFICSVKQH